jgi:hypothetical protein
MTFHVTRSVLIAGSAIALLSSACSLSELSPVGALDGSAADAGVTGPSNADSGGAALDAGSPATDSGAPAPDAPTMAAPFPVDPTFVSSGFMGDGETPGFVTVLPAKPTDNADCNGKRATPNAVGQCHQVRYSPPDAAGKGWAGVYWQYPANNWGTKAGYAIPPGASKVTFWAKGAAGGEQVSFLAGGIAGAGSAYQDTVKSQVKTTLTADWAQYSIDISGQSYTEVIGGFGWTMTATSAATSGQFFIDGIEWQ